MNEHFRLLSCFLSSAIFLAFVGQAGASTSHKQSHRAEKSHSAKHHRVSAPKKARHARHKVTGKRDLARSNDVAPPSAPPVELSGELRAAKDAIDLVRKGKISDATAIQKAIGDPAAQKLVEWVLLRHAGEASFSRYANFVAENPHWPSSDLIRRRAEARLWEDRFNATMVRSFMRNEPSSAKGRLALARVLLAEGDRDGAGQLVRRAWRSDELSERAEAEVIELFRDLLSSEDHRARMDKRIGAKDMSGAARAARQLGGDYPAIVKACAAVSADSSKAVELLDAIGTEARNDLGYTFCRINWMLRHDRLDDATRLMLAAAPDTMALQETDEWWRVRRVLARKLLDAGNFQSAYQVVRTAALPANQNYQAEAHFLPGWIALRYLNDPSVASQHFAHIDDGSVNPIVMARACYWRGRAAEAAGENEKMRIEYGAAARHTTAYYGQIARARLGLAGIELPEPPVPGSTEDRAVSDELVRAADILYSLGERELIVNFAADLANQSVDAGLLAAIGDLTMRRNDARSMLQIGKTALARGYGLHSYAFPTIGIPQHSQIAPEIEKSLVYSVARTESAFDQRDKSPANAVGLMQVTPEAGRDTAKRFGVTYDWDRMVSDPVYNTQMGAAELSALLREYNGSHILTFAGYNAGRGRVRQWIKLYGDPRNPDVDAVDWVERIPFAETRNYVQRVMENLLVYRVRFEPGSPMVSEFDQHRGTKRAVSSAAQP
jgi:soluble lytic murein transglycosylase